MRGRSEQIYSRIGQSDSRRARSSVSPRLIEAERRRARRSSTGQARSAVRHQNLAVGGDNIVSSTGRYVGTGTSLAHAAPSKFIEVRFRIPENPEVVSVVSPTPEEPEPYYAADDAQPKMTSSRFAEVAAIGRAFGIPVIVDNTRARF